MTDVRPFRALRYDPERVDLADVLAPVYDVVAPEDRAVYYDRHPHNALRLELTRSVEDEADADYSDVAATLAAWREEGVLRVDEEPAFYVLRQRFTAPDGQRAARTGFYAALRLEEYERRVVRPHERTLAGPKADRLKILRATHTNLSSVFLLYEDRDQKLETVLAAALASDETRRVTDDAGITHELVALRDPSAVAELQAFLEPRPVVIADGHHRYETALNYRRERREAGETDPEAGSERLLAYFANAFAAGSLLLPIHRLVLEAPAPDDAGWAALEGWRQEQVAVASAAEIPELLERHLLPHAPERFAFAADDGGAVLRVFSRPADGELSVRVIHREVLGGLFGLDDEAVRGGAIAFPKSTAQTARDVRNGRHGRPLPEPVAPGRRLRRHGGRRDAAAEVDLLLPEASDRARHAPAGGRRMSPRRGGRPRREPARIGGAIGRVLSELGHDLTSPALVVAASWEEIVGADIAAHSEPVDWQGETLEVAVTSPAWGQHLRLRQGELLEAMAELLGERAPRNLRFRVR